MPNRIIKESICTSDSVDELTWFEEVFFYRLIVNCDDYGRLDARPAILKARLFPLKSITERQIVEALNKLSSVGMVMVYKYGQRPYLQMATWNAHQQIRAAKSKYPAPPSLNESDIQPVQTDAVCNQLISDDYRCPRNPIQSESNPNQNTNVCTEQQVTPCQLQAVITLTLNDKTEYPVAQDKVNEWSALYPAVDVMQELRKMRAWLEANPKKRKTKAGIMRFITNWLSREQDKGRASPRIEVNDNKRTDERDSKNPDPEPGEPPGKLGIHL